MKVEPSGEGMTGKFRVYSDNVGPLRKGSCLREPKGGQKGVVYQFCATGLCAGGPRSAKCRFSLQNKKRKKHDKQR